MYTDWARRRGQATPGEKKITRDIIAWATQGLDSLPEYSPKDSVTMSVNVANLDSFNTAQRAVIYFQRPDRSVKDSIIYTVNLSYGDSFRIDYRGRVDSAYGIWWLSYCLFTERGDTVYQNIWGDRVAVSAPPISYLIKALAEGLLGRQILHRDRQHPGGSGRAPGPGGHKPKRDIQIRVLSRQVDNLNLPSGT
jgi:hypothetical protein